MVQYSIIQKFIMKNIKHSKKLFDMSAVNLDDFVKSFAEHVDGVCSTR